ncbi:hypothetical protein [Flammeovirga aprica]|uniref:Big-1 domain-containing protein n=1 Tax=Flammeovirga aprica JL-4 TaxID=694437 RepID=A0A7X9XBD2_9BACT|nr:hypothetical protein [Flammeovirga aprica]NME70615.1 hypothetical protein [Flammeovirga aprica JL-4]
MKLFKFALIPFFLSLIISCVDEDTFELRKRVPAKIQLFNIGSGPTYVNSTLDSVTFSVLDSFSYFFNGCNVIINVEKGEAKVSSNVITTDQDGYGAFDVTFGPNVDTITVSLSIPHADHEKTLSKSFTVVTEANPDEVKLKMISGNYQHGYSGGTLRNELTVIATDNYGNPIKDLEVRAHRKGEYRYYSNDETDEDGISIETF